MPKMQQNAFGSRTPPEPAGGAYVLPRPARSRNGVLLLRGGCLLIREGREQDGLLLRGVEREERASPQSHGTIRDAILTCARKPTRVGLIYSTETTTKKCKTEKLKSNSRYVRSNSKSLGNDVVSSEEEKERLQWKGFAEKGFKSGMKESG